MPPRVVLLRPRRMENVGAIARAMKNFGLRDWVAVDPPELDRDAAKLVATQSHDLVDGLRVTATLDEAIADCVWVVGTSSRSLRGLRRLEPREAAQTAVARLAEGPVAFVFGDESNGLTNEELARVHAVSSVPTDDAQPSINLAQSVLLYLYELRLAQRGERPLPPLPTAATDAELRRVESELSRVLTANGFLGRGRGSVVGELVAPLVRGRLTRQEARLWLAALAGLFRGRASR